MLTTILGWLFVGLIVGLVARLLLPGPQHIGIFPTIALGIVGALVGGVISWLFTGMDGDFSRYAWSGWLLSIVGAVLVLWLATSRKKRLRA